LAGERIRRIETIPIRDNSDVDRMIHALPQTPRSTA
jgi:hypothetical protein